MTRRLYDYDDAAEELRVEVTWLQRHIKRLPHVKLGRSVLFTDADLDEITELHHYRPQQRPNAPVAESSSRPLTDLKPLPRRSA